MRTDPSDRSARAARGTRFLSVVFPALTLSAGLALTAILAIRQAETDALYLEATFRFDAAQRTELIADEFRRRVDSMGTITRFIASSEYVSEEEFNQFVRTWTDSGRFKAIVWAEPADAPDGPARGSLALEPLYVVPASLAAELEAMGLYSRPELLEAVAAAGESASATRLMACPWEGPALALCAVVPTTGGAGGLAGAADADGTARRGAGGTGGAAASGPAGAGWILGVLDVFAVAESSINATPPAGLPTTIRDAGDLPEAPRYYHEPRLGVESAPGTRLGRLVYSRLMAMADRTWLLEVRASTKYAFAGTGSSWAYLAAAGTLASAALALLLRWLALKRHRAEALAAEKSAEFEHFFGTGVDLFAIGGIDGIISKMNSQWAESLGYTADELRHTRLYSLIHPDDAPATDEALDRLTKGQYIEGFVNRLLAKDGSERSFEWRASISPDGRVIYASARDITERLAMERERERSLVEKEALLKEIHHRVKNNMQIISSLLNLSAIKENDEKFRAAALEAQGRIRSMAMIHEQLYRQGDFAETDMGLYVRNLAGTLVRDFSARPVCLEVDIRGVRLDLDAAIPCGLALNELVTNALKHACGKVDEPTLRISGAMEDGHCALLVEDNGPGLPEGALEAAAAMYTLGLGLAQSLASQLSGRLSSLPGPGARLELRFPYPRAR